MSKDTTEVQVTGLPKPLKAEWKIAAVKRGKTLSELVILAMAEYLETDSNLLPPNKYE